MKIKKPSVAGQFYDANAEQLAANIESYVVNTQKECNYDSRAIIVPHAGHKYSGALAAKCFRFLKKDLETLFVFAPAHRYAVETYALPTDDAWECPLGEIYLHQDYVKEVQEMGGEFCDEAFINEHSLEVQLPFIKQFMPEVNIVPVLIGGADFHAVSNIISKYWDNENVGFVISSDLSHFRNKAEASRIDSVTAEMIENNVCDNMQPEQACGYKAICGIADFAGQKNYSLIRVGMTDSSAVSGDETSVVGYGAWFLAEQEKTEFLKEKYGNILVQLAQLSVKSQLENVNFRVENFPKALETKVATFVTLSIDGNLRGCIGTILGVEPLIVNVCKNARNAAFQDPRFAPVQPNEYAKLDFSVSLLSRPQRISFKDEQDLLEQLRPEVDGVIIKDIGRQSVYLPEVWKQLPDKTQFLTSLKQKAGLAPDWFSDTFEAYRFTTAYIQQTTKIE